MRNIIFMGIASFLTDVSSEMIFTLLPLFLRNVLGVSLPIIGIIEGIADSTATLTRLWSGWFSDRIGRRKVLALSGYSLSTISKLFLYFASSWLSVLLIRFFDRVGKGVRTPPRDALIADSSIERGKAFGFHRAMDTFGAVLGLLIAAIIIWMLQRGDLFLHEETFRFIVLIGIIPAFLACVIFFIFVRDVGGGRGEGFGLAIRSLSPRFKFFLVITGIFTLSNFSDAFIILRAQGLGVPLFGIMLLFVFLNIVYSLSSTPFGIISDRLGRKRVLFLSFILFGLSYILLGIVQNPYLLVPIFLLYGLYYGAYEGVGRAFVADLTSERERGTGYGIFHTVIGILAFPASLIAGFLWQELGPHVPFIFSASLSFLSAFLLLFL